jgi:hypothetical protein
MNILRFLNQRSLKISLMQEKWSWSPATPIHNAIFNLDENQTEPERVEAELEPQPAVFRFVC